MDAAPLISVVLPVHNVPAGYLNEAVASLLAQTEPRFELLLIDDFSTDDTAERCRAWAGRDARIRFLPNEAKGLVPALNLGLRQARGELIARMDGDDVAEPERFAAQLAYLLQNPDCVCVGADIVLIDPEGQPLARVRQETEHAAIEARLMQGLGGALCHPAVMMRREAVTAAGGYDPAWDRSEDLDLFLRLAEIGRLANLPQPLLRYRQHLASVNATKAAIQWENKRQLTTRARARRGLPPLSWTAKKFIAPTPGILHLRWARLAWQGGFRRTSWKHFGKAAARLPVELPTWFAFAAGFLKRRLLARFGVAAAPPRQNFGPVEAKAEDHTRKAA